MRRIGYRRTADVTGTACFARKHAASLASSGRTRDSTPHGVRSTDSGAKHLRYLGTGCSDRWLPISRTASSSTFLRRRTLRLVVNERCRMRFHESVSQTCRPTFQSKFGQAIFGRPNLRWTNRLLGGIAFLRTVQRKAAMYTASRTRKAVDETPPIKELSTSRAVRVGNTTESISGIHSPHGKRCKRNPV